VSIPIRRLLDARRTAVNRGEVRCMWPGAAWDVATLLWWRGLYWPLVYGWRPARDPHAGCAMCPTTRHRSRDLPAGPPVTHHAPENLMTLRTRTILAAAVLALTAAGLTACSSDAAVVSQNLSTDADQYKINRRVVFFNGITDKYLLEIDGLCSVTDANRQLEVTCKVGADQYKKHLLGLSDNVSYFVEQLDPATADPYHYKVIFKPETIVPDIEHP
jgi:hypothetical protein